MRPATRSARAARAARAPASAARAPASAAVLFLAAATAPAIFPGPAPAHAAQAEPAVPETPRDHASPASGPQEQVYFPGPGEAWESRSPEDVGMDADLLDAAVSFAIESEADALRDLALNHALNFGREPFGEATGPFKERGDPSGVILRHGYRVAEWGDPRRVDLTFSVTKSFLSSVVALALDRGLVRSLDDRVAPYMAPVTVASAPGRGAGEENEEGPSGEILPGEDPPLEPFASEHNRRITWDHLLRQTSDWEGTLWGKPDWADRPAEDRRAELERDRHEPGTVWEYNDVRVNVLALAALNLWRRPLPRVLRNRLMEPIGASPTWRWHGYENSWVLLDGELVQSVGGGGHWGGGMWISARDMARFGYLTLRDGRWEEERILPEEFLERARTPTSAEPTYGYMNYFLNPDREELPSAPDSAFFHLGAGTNAIYVDPEHDLVVVARWIERDALDGLVRRVIEAVD